MPNLTSPSGPARIHRRVHRAGKQIPGLLSETGIVIPQGITHSASGCPALSKGLRTAHAIRVPPPRSVSASTACCSASLIGTNGIFGPPTASQIASTSAASTASRGKCAWRRLASARAIATRCDLRFVRADVDIGRKLWVGRDQAGRIGKRRDERVVGLRILGAEFSVAYRTVAEHGSPSTSYEFSRTCALGLPASSCCWNGGLPK
jgi:hypothetical protein